MEEKGIRQEERATATTDMGKEGITAQENRETGVSPAGKEKERRKREPEKPLTPKQLQQRRKLLAYPLMGLLFLGSMWLIFAPSDQRDRVQQGVGAFNAEIPLPQDEGILDDKRTAYEQAEMEQNRKQRVRPLEDFAPSEEDEPEGAVAEPPGSNPEREPFRDYSGDRDDRSSVAAYRDINRQLGSFYEQPQADGEKEELKRQVEELTAKLEERERQAGGIDDQVALMEKSYELAAKYMGQNGKDGAAVQNDNSPRQPAVAVQVARERTVSGLQQPLSDAEFMRRYSQPRNYGFNTAVGSGYALGKNTIAACIHQDQTVMDGQQVKLRLLEPLQAGNLIIPRNTVVSGTGKVQGERLDITVSSVQYQGNILPVELAVYDNEGMKGLCIETSLEREAAKEAMANIGGGLGTSISFARSAGQQVAMDITRGLMQGGSQYLAKRFRTVKVHLKAGYGLMLYAKQQ